MREKELRLALVYFGGVSLAVYMHGIGREILKLVRASSALHATPDPADRETAAFFDRHDQADLEYDTEAIYFELLREIGRKVRLRVIVDIIAGASAGGINGTMLARALSHDLPTGQLRELWLDHADIDTLLAREARARSWSKWFLKPFIWGIGASGAFGSILDREVRRNLSLFIRSRWFQPPLSGLHMAGLMLDAVTCMGQPKNPGASLLPAGHQLDLFVTLTDYYGCQHLIQIHDPSLIHELEHRHILHFRYRRHLNGEVVSDFDLDNAPALAFAARATSSFPGVFPPAQMSEMERLLAERALPWRRREEFVAHNFERYARAGIDPATTPFLDGAVLNNKPFREAILAIRGRAAYRQVDRRLVYIDPDPAAPASAAHQHRPGFFTTLKGALSDIPRTEPIGDELNWVAGFNERVRRQMAIIESARPQITHLVTNLVDAPLDQPASVSQIQAWRETMNTQVARDAGFAYEGYVRLKLASARAFVSQLIVTLRGAAPGSPLARAIAEVVDAWAVRSGATYIYDHRGGLVVEAGAGADAKDLPGWMRFLLAFDLDFRKRRLHFLIQGQNRLYEMLDTAAPGGVNPRTVNRLKREFYRCLDVLRLREQRAFFSEATRDLAAGLFASAPGAAQARQIEIYARDFAESHQAEIDELVGQLAAEINLDSTTHDLDVLLAEPEPEPARPQIRREIFINYLGFPFWDLLTFSVTSWRDAGEFNEILVDRIGPDDAHSFPGFDRATSLKGIGIGHFAAFLSRAYRENDYLLGRLHALDRLIDIVCDSAGVNPADGNIVALKKRAFTLILDVEERHLGRSGDLIAQLRRLIAELRVSPP